jgi:hypothetical protein
LLHPLSVKTAVIEPDDRAEPAAERGRLGQRGKGVPGGEKRFLHDIFRLLEVPHVRQRIAKGDVLEPPDDVGKGVQVTPAAR